MEFVMVVGTASTRALLLYVTRLLSATNLQELALKVCVCTICCIRIRNRVPRGQILLHLMDFVPVRVCAKLILALVLCAIRPQRNVTHLWVLPV